LRLYIPEKTRGLLRRCRAVVLFESKGKDEKQASKAKLQDGLFISARRLVANRKHSSSKKGEWLPLFRVSKSF